ncbi:MAG TPA: ATP-binding protein [Terriglobales bacterium]|nr:ATP-binding protein [Terriglobales bacterium]
MQFIQRQLASVLQDASRHFPAIVLTGPRRAGKTTLFRSLFPKARYILLEDPDIQGRVRSDPRAFLEELRPPVIFDEIQNTPELLGYVRTIIDLAPRRMGQWLFTGSQEAPLMRGISESMAGRAAILQLMPFSLQETNKVNLLHGGFPEVLARPRGRALWFASYLQTYLERDVRSIANVRDLATFRRFLALVASRHGQVLNRTDLAAPLGVSTPTVSEWLHILEITGQIHLVPPYFENFGKRLIKSPKVYIGDSGLACYLLGLTSQAEVERSPFLGALFEGMVASEILKGQINGGGRKELYYFRDQQGLEIDFLIPRPGTKLWLVEAKAAKTVRPAMAAPLFNLQRALSKRATRLLVVHRHSHTGLPTAAIAKGVEALDLEQFAGELSKMRNLK